MPPASARTGLAAHYPERLPRSAPACPLRAPGRGFQGVAPWAGGARTAAAQRAGVPAAGAGAGVPGGRPPGLAGPERLPRSAPQLAPAVPRRRGSRGGYLGPPGVRQLTVGRSASARTRCAYRFVISRSDSISVSDSRWGVRPSSMSLVWVTL